MSPSPFIDAALVPLSAALEAQHEVFLKELTLLQPRDFVPWHEKAAYSEGWMIFPLILRMQPVPSQFDLERSRRLCPHSCEILSRHDRILCAGFSRLLPGSRIFRHTDRPKPGVLRMHLGLETSASAPLSFDDETARARTGRIHHFDHSLPHTAENTGEKIRDVLLVDYETLPEEAARISRVRGGVNLGETVLS